MLFILLFIYTYNKCTCCFIIYFSFIIIYFGDLGVFFGGLMFLGFFGGSCFFCSSWVGLSCFVLFLFGFCCCFTCLDFPKWYKKQISLIKRLNTKC